MHGDGDMIRTTVVGSWPLPGRYAEGLGKYHRGEAGEGTADPILREAIALAIREQKRTGVDQVTGGGLAFDSFLTRLPRFLTGIEAIRAEREAPGRSGGFYRLRGPLQAPRGIGFASAFRREVEIDGDIRKGNLPGPLSLLNFLVLVDPSALKALSEAVAIVRKEVAALVQAGAREVQVDASTEVTAVHLLNQDPIVVADAIAGVFAPARGVVRTVHLCLGGLRGSASTPEAAMRDLLPLMRRLEHKIDRLHIECLDAGVRALLQDVPKGMEIVAGVASAGNPEPVDVLVERTREILRYVGAERLWLAPACGLRSCSNQQAIGILTHLVAAARRCGT